MEDCFRRPFFMSTFALEISQERLPEEFTNADVMRCFNLATEGAARSKLSRLLSDHLIEKVSDSRGNEKVQTLYRKTGTVML